MFLILFHLFVNKEINEIIKIKKITGSKKNQSIFKNRHFEQTHNVIKSMSKLKNHSKILIQK